jgi:hypothetical protein
MTAEQDGRTVYVTIGNSDDRLTQADWADFYQYVDAAVDGIAAHIYGRWVSLPTARYQNACWALLLTADRREQLRRVLRRLARRYRQESIAWVEGDPTFLTPMED